MVVWFKASRNILEFNKSEIQSSTRKEDRKLKCISGNLNIGAWICSNKEGDYLLLELSISALALIMTYFLSGLFTSKRLIGAYAKPLQQHVLHPLAQQYSDPICQLSLKVSSLIDLLQDHNSIRNKACVNYFPFIKHMILHAINTWWGHFKLNLRWLNIINYSFRKGRSANIKNIL